MYMRVFEHVCVFFSINSYCAAAFNCLSVVVMATQKKPDIFLNMLFRPGGKSGVPSPPWHSVLDMHRPRSFGAFLPRYQQVRVTIFTDAQRLSAQQQSLSLKRKKEGRRGMSSSTSGAEFGPTYMMSYQALSQSAVGMSSLAPSQTAALVGQSQYLDGDENGGAAPEPEDHLNKAMEKGENEEEDEAEGTEGTAGGTQSNSQEFAPWSGESAEVEEVDSKSERRETEVLNLFNFVGIE